MLAGVHGAGLAHVASLAPAAGALLEVQVPGYAGNHHYQRMAAHGGLLYRLVVRVQFTPPNT